MKLLTVLLVMFAFTASSWASPITLNTGGATLTVPGCTFVDNGQTCVDPPLTLSTTVTGPNILGGTVEMTLAKLSVQNPFGVTASGGYLEGIGGASLLFEWDANGAGLDLDLSDMMGLTVGRFSSDGGYVMSVRLLSLHDSLFAFSANLDDASAIGDVPNRPLHSYRVGTYAFDRFEAIGNPNLRHINAVQIEIVKTGGVAGLINAVSFAPTPTPVPDGGSTIVLLSIGLVIVALWRTTTLS